MSKKLNSDAQYNKLVADIAQAVIAKIQGTSQLAPAIVPSVAAIMPTQTQPARSSAKVTRMSDVPTHGDLACKVNVNSNGELCARTKLPMGLFDDGFARVVLTLPTGEQIAVDKDAEGRARMAKGTLQRIGAKAGQYLVFDKQEDGYFLVSLSGHAQATQPRPAQSNTLAPVQTQTQRTQYRPIGDDPFNLGGLFVGTANVAQTRPSIAAMYSAPREDMPTTGKKPRTAKQLENDRKLGERARLRAQNAQTATQAGTVASGSRQDAQSARLTPIYVQGGTTKTSARKDAVKQIAALTGTRAILMPVRG